MVGRGGGDGDMLALCSNLTPENKTKTTHQGHLGRGLEASHGSEGEPDSHKARVTTSVGSPLQATATARPLAPSPPCSPSVRPTGRGRSAGSHHGALLGRLLQVL